MAADQAEWLDRLDAELGNLRAAIAFSLTQPDPEPGLRLAASLRVYWQARGHAAEGSRRAAGTPGCAGRPGGDAAACPGAGRGGQLLERTGGYAVAGDYCQEALAIARAAGDDHLVAEPAV